MARPCTICRHPNRADIEKGLALSRRVYAIAAEFGVGKDAIARHRAHIVPERSITLDNTPEGERIAQLEAETRAVLAGTKVEKIKLDAIARLQSLRADRARLHAEQTAAGSLAGDPAYQAIVGALLRCLCPPCLAAVDAELARQLGTPLSATAPTPGDTRADA